MRIDMSGQIIELIIFAGIAVFVINKLISTLGSTSEDDPTLNQGKSFFGERNSGIKDVTGTGVANDGNNIIRPYFNKKAKLNLDGFIVPEHKEEIEQNLQEIQDKLPSFDLAKFVKGSKAAFGMIIKSAQDGDNSHVELVDKRYLEHFKAIASSYGIYNSENSDLNAHVSELYTFGNNIFIKVLFFGKNITDKISEFHEEWTFTKSVLSAGPEWHLTNIDRPQ